MQPRWRLVVISAAFAVCGAAGAARAAEYDVTRWPADLEKVPCDAFKHNPDGSWSQVATIRVSGMPTFGKTYSKSPETEILDKKCGAPAADAPK